MNDSRHGRLITSTLALMCILASACGDDDGGGGAAAIGPQITFFGVIRANDALLDPSGMTRDGVPIYTRVAGATGVASGFRLVIEGTPGHSGAAVGVSSYDPSLTGFPDLVIVTSRNLGNGSAQVCDDPITMPGGVPATSPPSYEETAENIAKVNDFACRFVDGTRQPVARQATIDSCVDFEGDNHFVAPQTTTQYCGFIDFPLGFQMGDTTVTARLRDILGNLGPEESVVIRVVP